MKLQAHLPSVSIGARDWHAATVAWTAILGASILLLVLESSGFLNNLLLAQFQPLSISPFEVDAFNPVSLDIHSLSSPIDSTRRFSVAHQLPENVASSQPFSIGGDARGEFETFGDSAQRDMLADENTARQLKPNDRLMLMLMLLRLHPHRQ
ncbi:hypothetical protein [Candidatus Binatus sp.]|uniref:hypothetical protein n=1 Tax=Candidatus Binatus sp. TaxID=2811406 RepID=UPI003C56B6A2